MDQHECNLLSTVHSLLLSMNKTDLHYAKEGQCNASCIRQFLVKLLRLSGYDVAVYTSKWQGSGKVPGGDHEYIDVIVNGNIGGSDRLIVDIDFRSHFEIARAVESYDAILASLPVFLPKLMHSCLQTSKDVQSKHQSCSTRSCTKSGCEAPKH
ncbi:hypothetical protein IHE45_09G037500 [Dioscorea alata]|uniref:Uncharacterized protein n=1 Tax=Dioscorea alata TaxID=55571 RepID=A0ACB7VEH3_DIOAL|nr:hypothetical protein IHE45_09G037500 [Dioscorea alata]